MPALALYQSLTNAQPAKATLSPSDPNRVLEQFPHDPRRGLAVYELSREAEALTPSLLESAYSPWEAHQARRLPKLHLAFYGESDETSFDQAGMEWCLSGHHLTLFGFTNPRIPARIGPLLLGADPSILWPAEEAGVAALQTTLIELPKEQAGALTEPIGTPVADLPKAARHLHEKNGGMTQARLHFEDDAAQPSEKGERYYVLLSDPALNFWIDTRATHPHTLLDIPGLAEA